MAILQALNSRSTLATHNAEAVSQILNAYWSNIAPTHLIKVESTVSDTHETVSIRAYFGNNFSVRCAAINRSVDGFEHAKQSEPLIINSDGILIISYSIDTATKVSLPTNIRAVSSDSPTNKRSNEDETPITKRRPTSGFFGFLIGSDE
jgi:hypothetical protein